MTHLALYPHYALKLSIGASPEGLPASGGNLRPSIGFSGQQRRQKPLTAF
jgi:hypothetical protein